MYRMYVRMLIQETLIKAINSHPGVLVTSYAGVRINQEELHRYHWNYIILDEGHKIRNPHSAATVACKKVCIMIISRVLPLLTHGLLVH